MAPAKAQSRRFTPATMATVALAAGGKTALAAVLFDTPYQVNPPANGVYTETVSGTEGFGAWTATFNTPLGTRSRTVDTTAAPSSLQLSVSTARPSFTVTDTFLFTTTVPGDAPSGLVSFDYNYVEDDTFSLNEFAYTLNGAAQTITAVTGSSAFNFSVNPGDTFGFVLSSSYYNTNSSVTITNFNAPAVPEPSALMLLATGFAGVVGLRYLRRRTTTAA